jgi:mannosyltransferase
VTALPLAAGERAVSVAPTHRARGPIAVLRRSLALRASLLGALGALVAGWGVWSPSYWGDEAASVMSAERSLPSLLGMAGQVDGVHTTYYALLHLWIGVAGTTELATRGPSAVAIGFLVAAVVVMGQRVGGARLGVVAGIVAIALPRDLYMASETRSYAFAAAAAAWIGVLLVHLLHGRHARWQWIALGVAIGATAWLFLYVVLLVPVVAAIVLVLRRDLLRPAIGMAAAAVVVAAPIVLVAYAERDQIAFLAQHAFDIRLPFVSQWFMKPWPAAVGWAAIVAGAVLTVVRRRGIPALVIAGAWAVVPTALLLLGNLVLPLYTTRYLSFCTPAVALLVGIGIVRLAESVHGRMAGLAVAGASLVVVAAVAAPVYLQQRGPFGQEGGADFRQAANRVRELARPGDAVIFDEAGRPFVSPRLALDLYPDRFAGLRDVELVTPAAEHDQLWDVTRPLADALPDLGTEVIAVENGIGPDPQPDIVALERAGYRVDAMVVVHRETVYRMVLPAATSAS